MNWAYTLIVQGIVLSAVLNLIVFGIYKLISKKNKEDES